MTTIRVITAAALCAMTAVACSGEAPGDAETRTVTLYFEAHGATQTLDDAGWDELVAVGDALLVQSEGRGVTIDRQAVSASAGDAWVSVAWTGATELELSTSDNAHERIYAFDVPQAERDDLSRALLGLFLGNPATALEPEGLAPKAYYGRAWSCLQGCDWYDAICAAACIIY
jgi:hypothetical protein